MKDPWPWPEDTQLERARRITQSYRWALMTVDPDHCRKLDDRAVELGQAWVRPIESEVVDLDELLSPEQIGQLLSVMPGTVRKWGERGHIENLGQNRAPLFRWRDVIDYCARARQARQRDKIARDA
ncbi:hypothetical protein OG874_00445 [Nocardia sp. NBC_00565]|uniref:hypothetical protein n=1 Tax=Nocardia sp. NBC_00565 TaxID=2975993 RepID=UPI002E814F11|nr:hypothetical protein [Nocardia sp. NBC_00565]WUC03724.1 hypothetical protein OG874_00445 [Nocardia sp. NBC_00565]